MLVLLFCCTHTAYTEQLTSSLGSNGTKLRLYREASVAEWLACLQYDPWSVGLNPASVKFCLLFITYIFQQCS